MQVLQSEIHWMKFMSNIPIELKALSVTTGKIHVGHHTLQMKCYNPHLHPLAPSNKIYITLGKGNFDWL